MNKNIIGILKKQNITRIITPIGVYGNLFLFFIKNKRYPNTIYDLPSLEQLYEIIDTEYQNNAEELKKFFTQSLSLKIYEQIDYEFNEDIYNLISKYGIKRK